MAFHGEEGFFVPPTVQDAYNIINFCFLIKKQHPKKFGSVDVKITPDLCSQNVYATFSIIEENLATQTA